MSGEKIPEIIRQDEVTIMVFGQQYANLEIEVLEQLTEIVADAAHRADPPRIVIDLSETTYFGSDFVTILIQGWKRLKEHEGAKLAVCGVKPFVEQLLAVTQLDRLWEIYSTRDEAVAALTPQRD